MGYNGYLIDLDGTMYNGSELIETARDFVSELERKGIPYVFLTNNATKSQEEAVQKLLDMGVKTSLENMYTSAMATASYIRENHRGASAYVIGTPSLKKILENAGITLTEKNADLVIMGLDPEVDYGKLKRAALLIGNGAGFIATNPDKRFPTEEGIIPGSGALQQVLIETTGVRPLIIGKPNASILDGAMGQLGLKKSEVALIGDNYDTDIMTGINGGVDTIHVNTGVSPVEEVMKKEASPTHTIDNLSEWSV
ncbi:TIGR01457 family HAD-type hydrolase [Lacicoccus alkaliphilus]|uniref:4-nitrophenyl phosphatase n=1 Tax=Lacicoccus alkaliphilus DSM 16010 TaxID=1123231 RepID=A0A1M7FHB4_9BACL|nr:TIGR01457 family HAD-type hydrolase [Salinicoccus alkaliphilus]SHM03363.1 4-nitrophenyl phosphatase [Salinicoccus alkaliphilus DSM 16010]